MRICLLASFGALALGLAAWLLSFGFGSTSGSPFGPLVFLGGIVVLLLGLFFLGGAGLDAVWARLEKLRARQR